MNSPTSTKSRLVFLNRLEQLLEDGSGFGTLIVSQDNAPLISSICKKIQGKEHSPLFLEGGVNRSLQPGTWILIMHNTIFTQEGTYETHA